MGLGRKQRCGLPLHQCRVKISLPLFSQGLKSVIPSLVCQLITNEGHSCYYYNYSPLAIFSKSCAEKI